MPNDLYVFALSAKDGFGNFAVAGSSNDFYVAGTIPIDRTQQQPQADITPPNVTATNPQVGATIPPFTFISATLVDPIPSGGTPPPTGVSFSSSGISLTGPAGNAIAGTTSIVGLSDRKFTLTDPTSGAVPGVYVMRVTPRDNSFNTGTLVTVTFSVSTGAVVVPAQIENLIVTWSPTDKTSTINWNAISGASGYIVYRKFGIWTSTSTFVVGVTTVATGVTLTTYKDIVGGPGAWTYGVRQEGVGGDVSSIALETSRNRFIRNVNAVDGTGGQLGKGGAWNFSYRLEDNAVVDIIVLSSNSQVGISTTNRFATYRDTDVVKNVISSAPRAAEGAGGWTNADTWNLTDKNNQGVAQGIYTVLFQAHLSTGNPYLPLVDRDVYVMQVTVDKTAQAAPGDSTPPSVASTFPQNQARLPRVAQVSAVLADNVAVNTAASSVVLTVFGSTVPIAGVKTALVNTLYFTLSYSSDGAVATSYTLTVVPVDQAANNGQATVVNFIVDPTSPTIVSVSPSTGSTLNATFTTVSAKLSDLGGAGLDLAGSQITLTNPSGVSIAGTVTNNAVDTLTLTVPEQKFNGKYTVTIVARDQAGNSVTLSDSFTLNTPLSATTEEFGKTFTVDQNPARAPVKVYFDIPAAGDTTFEVFNLLGERVYSQTDSWSGGGRQTVSWSLVNNEKAKIGTGVYTYRVRFTGGGTNLEAKKKLVVGQ